MRLGTRKSRAPSGDDAVRIGVENSVKPDIGHALRACRDDLGAGHDVLVQRLAAQVEEAVLQADVFRIIGLAKHRQRQFLADDSLRQRTSISRANTSIAPVGRCGSPIHGLFGARLHLGQAMTRITHSPWSRTRSLPS
jgi:hypothetical protein